MGLPFFYVTIYLYHRQMQYNKRIKITVNYLSILDKDKNIMYNNNRR